MSIRTVAVLGAGHGGCAAAADLGRRGFAVRLHTRNAERLEQFRRRGGNASGEALLQKSVHSMVRSACGEPRRPLFDEHEEGSDEQTRFHQSEHSGICSRHDSCRWRREGSG
jgi:phytoene dehydrogenase-like protein